MSAILRVARVEARLVPFRWAGAEENAARIAAHWRERVALRPTLFNGRVLMTAGLDQRGDVAEARFFATDYANLLTWIESGCPDPDVANGFAMGALLGRDGGFVLGRMADHTANAGRLYFPCGTPDMSDVTPSGEVDLGASLVREIEEETGIRQDELAIDPGWKIVREGGLLAFMRTAQLRLDAQPARDRILSHIKADPKPELSDICLVRSLADLGDALVPAVVPAFLRDAFGEA